MSKIYFFNNLSSLSVKLKATTPKGSMSSSERSNKLSVLLLHFFLLVTAVSAAQTTLISPTGDGGFENGTTFPANNWTVTSGTATQNQWVCNTGATAGFSGTRCAYITNNNVGTPVHSYTLSAARVTHLYRNVTVPAAETNLNLAFNWIGLGEGVAYDKMKIWLVPTAFTPVYGTAIIASGTAPSGNVAVGLANYNMQASWTSASIILPASYAGTTFKLVFEWSNDGSLGSQPPSGIDNISLTSSTPTLCAAPSNQAGSFVAGTITSATIAASFSGIANEYLVIQSTSNAPPTQPVNGITYTAGNIGSLGTGLTFVQSSASINFIATSLNPSTTYYFFIYSYNNTSCSGGPAYKLGGALIGNGTTLGVPANDECVNAIPLSISSACAFTTYTNANATASNGIPAPGCASYAGGDVWFTAVVSATGILTVDTQTGVITDAGMAFYTGTCGSLTLLACDDDSSVNGLMPYISLSGLTPSQTIFIRVWEYGNDNNGTFGICATSPTCIAPTLNASTNITASTATINWTAPTSLPAAGYQYIVTTINTTPVGSGTATAALTASLSSLTANTTYYVFVRSNCGSGDFSPWTASGTFDTGYCSSTSSTSGYYISSFSTSGGTANISNNSGYAAGGYSLVAQSVSQINYGSVSFSAAFFNGINTYGFNIWVDWNDDMDFNDPNELVYASGSYVSSAAGSFTVPAGATVGNHRMRIRANYFSTNPSACGTITNGETEDYTFTVLAPLPCSGNPTSITVTATSQTTATVNWIAAAPAPATGYQYYLSLSNTTPSAAASPTGSVGAGITTINLTGLTSGSSYSIWIRSNCGGALGQGVWVGPIGFFQPNCTVGNGTGTTTLGCPSVTSGGLGLSGTDPAPINSCVFSSCVDLEASYLQLGQTTDYTVASIPYAPPYQFGCLQNPVSINIDDVWSQPINLPFDFCFYGNNYNQCLIGSNGALTFDLINNTPGGYSTWSFANNLPNTLLFKNTIFGVYQDIDPSIGGEVSWELVTLNSGCRALVASWSKIPMFSATCNAQLYTGMMVLYENTNIIDVYIQEKNVCSSWNGGNAIVGLQNVNGTQAVVAPNRNGLDADWTVTNEAWRFVPSGASITAIKWYEGAGILGTVVGTTSTLSVCPTATTTYTAEVTYTLCNGTKLRETDQTTVTVTGNKTWNGSVDTDWNKANNWTPSGIPNATDCVVIPITSNNPIVSGSNYNGLAGTLSVLNGATLTVNSYNSITSTNWVNVQTSGIFQIENNASLIQINDVVNVGAINYKRDADLRKLDYAYWSSPVANFNVSDISTPLALGPIYTWNTTIANPNGGQGNWEGAAGNIMLPAKGYIVRAPSSFSPTAITTLNGLFRGVPNNGIITTPISRGSDINLAFHAGINGTQITNYSDNNNLVGNPYPSAIRGSQFLFDNTTKIEGNIKLWTHGALPAAISSPFYNTFVYNYSLGDYLTFNFTGTSCCPTAPSDLFIGAGQGFFIQMKDGAPSADIVTFNNNLRSANYDNSIFYRNANRQVSNNLIDLERNRIWLDIIDSNNLSDRTLIGYIEGASNDRDSFFDATTSITPYLAIYSLIDNAQYNIQGRTLPFDQNDMVPLGITIPTDGLFKIGINALDGLFENTAQHIYLEDVTLGIIHDLRQEPYSFVGVSGNYENRFILRYTDGTLGINDVSAYDLSAFINHQKLFANASQNIQAIIIYDVSGKRIVTYIPKEKSRTFTDSFDFAKGVYFAKITLESGLIFTKKIRN